MSSALNRAGETSALMELPAKHVEDRSCWGRGAGATGFPGALVVKNPCKCRTHKRHGFDPWVRKTPWSGLLYPSSGALSHPRIELRFSALAGRFFTTEPSGKA